METSLCPHPACPSLAVDRVAVEVERLSATDLRFRYLVAGRIDQLVLPTAQGPSRTDHLWKTTCFEAFLAPARLSSYLELNFSPSSQWAAYHFEAYRAGIAKAPLPAPPEILAIRQADRLTVTATLSLDLPHEPYMLGLAAVIEERGGRKAYFAAAHGGEAPDFHRRDCFRLELPAAARA